MKKLVSLFICLGMLVALIPATVALADGTIKTINCGTFTLKIPNVYAMDSVSSSGGDGFTTIYFVVVSEGAAIEFSNHRSEYRADYLLWPFSTISFPEGALYPPLERAVSYEDAEYVQLFEGDVVVTERGNEYYFTGGSNGVWHGVRVFVVDAAMAASVGGTTLPSEPVTSEPASSEPASDLAPPGAATSEPASSEPASDPAPPGAATSEPASSEPASDPAPSGPATSEPAASERSAAEPVEANLTKTTHSPPWLIAGICATLALGLAAVVWVARRKKNRFNGSETKTG